ncbi:MAG: D-glycero-beta-D-manno-heptose 1-phosphate adenylyltransferase [Chthonomonadetes bacterium]|nr:D-glycero-beta-D-manno-heptose 1-phosphate adenylyltransferase [Chthonomonadetes bacterium]
MGKIVGWDELLRLREQWRRDGKTVVWTNGCFDLLHLGHVKGLQAAKSLGDVLVVGLNSDSSVRQLKGSPRPVFPQQYRAEMLCALECVDYVTIFDDLTPERLLAELQPDVHCKGADYADGKPMPEAEVVRAYGGRVAFIPLYESYSTTEILRRISILLSEEAG